MLLTPIAEHITLSSVGAATTGMRPIAELMFNDFIGFGLDPILNQGAKCVTCLVVKLKSHLWYVQFMAVQVRDTTFSIVI